MWEEIINKIINSPVIELRVIHNEDNEPVGFARIILDGLNASVDNIDADEFEMCRLERSFDTLSVVPEKAHKHDMLNLGLL
jgi:hypothetical protein